MAKRSRLIFNFIIGQGYYPEHIILVVKSVHFCTIKVFH
jgi:hypothetical protein